MRKSLSFIKASMSEGMKIFDIKSGKVFPIVVALFLLATIFGYSNTLLDSLIPGGMPEMLITIFVAIASITTLFEGVYKTSSLLFNCKDDDLLLSLPLKRSAVLATRIIKFYIFELVYNSLILLPPLLAYVIRVDHSALCILSSVLVLLFTPIIPIILSAIIGFIVSSLSSHFRLKNILQIIFTTLFMLAVMFFSIHSEQITGGSEDTTDYNAVISQIYYPAGASSRMLSHFDIKELLVFLAVHFGLSVVVVFALSKFYFRVNSRIKITKSTSHKKNVVIKSRTKLRALVKKEFSKLFNTPVFLMNTGLSLVIFIFLSAALIIKFDEAANMLIEQTPELSIDFLRSILPAVYFGLICMGSFMTFITCSMVSLEGKMFYYLKSLPIKPATLLFAKILTSLLFVTPLMLAFDVLMVYHFQFDFLSSIAIFAASFIFPAITACIGILLNLRYPKLDFESEAEVVKQSMSTLISSVLAILMTVVSIALIATLIALQLPIPAVLWIITGAYSLICALLYLLLNKVGIKLYYKIK